MQKENELNIKYMESERERGGETGDVCKGGRNGGRRRGDERET